MIIEGNKTNPCRKCGTSKDLAAHLEKRDTNEQVTVKEIRGFVSDNLRGAFQELNAVAAGTRAEKAAYHAKIALPEGERFTDEQMQKAVDKLETSLGFEGQPRAVVEHEKHGRQHFHVVWSRIDLEKMKAIDTPENYRKHEEVARELEKEFSLSNVKGAFSGRGESGARPERNAPKWEYHQAERLNTKKPREMKAEVIAIRESCKDGQQFKAALEKAGYSLAQGEKSGFCLIDQSGGVHNLAKYSGMKAAELRNFMNGIERGQLPTVEQAQEQAEQKAQVFTAQQQQERRDERQKAWSEAKEKTVFEKAAKEIKSIKSDIEKMDCSGLRVMGGMANKAGKVLDKVADVAEAILDMFDPPTPRKITPQELFASKQARAEREAQLEAEKERGAALDRMAESVRKSKTVTVSDIRAMNRNDLEAIRDKGGDHILLLIRQREKEQRQERERRRER